MYFAAVAPGAYGYQGAAVGAFYDDLLDRARQQPGIDAAALVSHVPLNSLYGGGARQGHPVGVARDPGVIAAICRVEATYRSDLEVVLVADLEAAQRWIACSGPTAGSGRGRSRHRPW